MSESSSESMKRVPVAYVLEPKFASVFPFREFNEMQSQCIRSALQSPDNLVIGAPTGSGKTTVFELALIRQLILASKDAKQGAASAKLQGKVFYVAPLKAIAAERCRDWKRRFPRLNFLEVTGDTVFLHPSNFTRSIAKANVILT